MQNCLRSDMLNTGQTLKSGLYLEGFRGLTLTHPKYL